MQCVSGNDFFDDNLRISNGSAKFVGLCPERWVTLAGQQEFLSVWRLAVLPSVTSTVATWSPMKTIWRPASRRTFAAVLSSKLKRCYWSRGSASCGSRKALWSQLASRRSLERDARKEHCQESTGGIRSAAIAKNVPCELWPCHVILCKRPPPTTPLKVLSCRTPSVIRAEAMCVIWYIYNNI